MTKRTGGFSDYAKAPNNEDLIINYNLPRFDVFTAVWSGFHYSGYDAASLGNRLPRTLDP
jgi:hypothetical protein